jgi:hypothetical protein
VSVLALGCHRAQVRDPPTPNDQALSVRAPLGWTVDVLPPPDLSQVPQIALEQWSVWGGPQGEDRARLVAACFATEAQAWAPEMDPLALEKLEGMAASTAVRVSGVGTMRSRSTGRGASLVEERLDGTGEAEGLLRAHLFLGFVATRQGTALRGCYALCSGGAACEASVDDATLRGSYLQPPGPSLTLRALLAIVHHPACVGWTLAGLSCLLCVVAIATRRRPRAT